MPKLEVIVTSAGEAVVAAAGGADRLELVRELEEGGLTPAWETAQAVVQAVPIPVRVMLRENSTMSLADEKELEALRGMAAQLQRLPIDGLVMGWIGRSGELDLKSLAAVLERAPNCQITFHRAFENLVDPLGALKELKQFSRIDRILTGGGAGSWTQRKQRLREWSQAAAPEIEILVGGGLSATEVAELMADAEFSEIHVGRAARTPEENDGVLDAPKIALLKTRRRQ
jgi:copper homeostasis protein